MPKKVLQDLTGQKFSRLTVISRAENASDGRVQWHCICDCGRSCIIRAPQLKHGLTKTCGCFYVRHLEGQRYGRLLVLRFSEKKVPGGSWVCRCDCGVLSDVKTHRLLDGSTQSCGCLSRERARARVLTHGRTRTHEYRVWQGMRERCTNQKHRWYKRYGGRGIYIAPEFLRFEGFYAYMGDAPPDTTLDRIDNDGPYAPGNVRWADHKTQHRNTSAVRLLTFNGATKSIAEWAEDRGLKHSTLWRRIKAGWSVERALS